jgi:predicted metal-dependent phosphoesterase TrpH
MSVLSEAGASIPTVTIDLHVHTTASDGTQSPAEVVARAAELGVSTIAITDHDTVAGLDEAIDAGAHAGIEIVPGIELSVRAPQGQLHLLAYLPEPHPPTLVDVLADLQSARRERADRIADLLDRLGAPVDMDMVRAGAGSAIGRPHLADGLVRAGHAKDRDDAFTRYLGDGGPAFVPHEMLSPDEAIALVTAAGGVTSIAHPGTLRLGRRGLEAFAARLRHRGLWGIEIYRAEHLPDYRHALAGIASRLGLVATGGSDFHGPRTGRGELGDTGVPGLPDTVADVLHVAIDERVASGP